jgi:hypothetical protein
MTAAEYHPSWPARKPAARIGDVIGELGEMGHDRVVEVEQALGLHHPSATTRPRRTTIRLCISTPG